MWHSAIHYQFSEHHNIVCRLAYEHLENSISSSSDLNNDTDAVSQKLSRGASVLDNGFIIVFLLSG
jgi:hypothetical protein